MAENIEWKEPPPRADRSTRWSDIARNLRENPQKWALVGQYSLSMRYKISSGQVTALSDISNFEIESRPSDKSGYVDVYMRYVGKSK